MFYIGSGGIEKTLIQKTGVPFFQVTCGKLRRYFSWQNFVDAFRVPVGIGQSYFLLKKLKPDVVFSKGGFVSLPVSLGAWMAGIPLVLHESDFRPGLANKISARFAKVICTSFEGTKKFFEERGGKNEIIVTGNPIRKSIFSGDEKEGLRIAGFNRFKPVILVMGGSQGAEKLNKLVREALPVLTKKFQILHIAGKGGIDIGIHKEGYKQFEFLDEPLRHAYAMSSLVVSRGGANSLFEIAALGKKAVIIPLSGEASRGDQIDNAKIFAKKHSWSVLSGFISAENFISAINLAFHQKFTGEKEQTDAAKKISEILFSIINRKK